MVVGKVSEFIGSLYYLCVTLLRFKNIMKLKNYLLLFALLLVVGVRAQVPSGNKYPKREFRGAWIQAVNGQFKGCLLYTSPSPRDRTRSRMPSSA